MNEYEWEPQSIRERPRKLGHSSTNEQSVNYIALLEDRLDNSIRSLTVSKKEEEYRDNQRTTSPLKIGLDVMQSHSLRRARFGQYQASSAALG